MTVTVLLNAAHHNSDYVYEVMKAEGCDTRCRYTMIDWIQSCSPSVAARIKRKLLYVRCQA